MKLPPLNAIKAFEATVRYGGFTAAAAELGVSSAAISLQVRKAEDYLGKQLFIRGNNTLTLTDAGQLLYPQVAQSLSSLATITEQFLEHDARSQLVVSTLQSLADKWVAPAVARFHQTNPDVGIAVLIESDPVDFARQRIDLRLTYGSQHYSNMSVTPIFRETVMPLCAPKYAKRCDFSVNNVPDQDLIHIDWGETYASYPTWDAWYRKAGLLRYSETRKGLRVAGTGVAVELAVQGVGVALAPLRLSSSHLNSGALVQLDTCTLPLAFDHCVVMHREDPKNGIRPRNAKLVRAFLRELHLTPGDDSQQAER